MKKNIFIAGSSGLIGSKLKVELSKEFNIIDFDRHNIKSENYFAYDKQNSLIPDMNGLMIINCAFNFNDLNIHSENQNLIIVNNLLKFKNKNKISFLINLSTLSSFKTAKSKYGKLKYFIETFLSRKIGCYSIRIGLPEYKGVSIGLLKKIKMVTNFFPLINFYFKSCPTQRITSIENLSIFIKRSFICIKTFPRERILNCCYDIDYDFNTLIKKNIYLFSIPVNDTLLYKLLLCANFLGINFFRADSFIGLINCNKNIKI